MSDVFQKMAEDWDADDLVTQLSSAIGKTILEQVLLHKQMEVMDFGAGTGLLCLHIAPWVNKIMAVDTSKAMLDRLVAKSELQGNVKIVCQDITETPLNRQFDLIISAMAMHHVANTEQLIQRFAEHLKPGARIALADLDEEDGSFHPEDAEGVFHSGFQRGKFKELLHASGFSNVQYFTPHTLVTEGKAYSIFLVTATLA